MKKINVIHNPVDLPYACVSYFIGTGMKDDALYSLKGLSHLTEHIVIEQFKKIRPEIYKRNLINAYVDKEFTCYYAIVLIDDLGEVISAFNRLFQCLEFNIEEKLIESQKDIILNIENERALSNHQLLNILSLEEKIFKCILGNTTLVDESIMKIDQNDIKRYINEMYKSSEQYLIVSSKMFDYKLENLFVHQNIKKEITSLHTNFNRNIKYNKIQDIDSVRKTVAISIDSVSNPVDYYSLNILCLFYKIIINNQLKDVGIYLTDVYLKLYGHKVVLYFSYNNFFEETMSILKKIDFYKFVDCIEEVKKHFLFGFIQKNSNLLDFNKELFKIKHFFGTDATLTEILATIQGIELENFLKVHSIVKKGEYKYLNKNE